MPVTVLIHYVTNCLKIFKFRNQFKYMCQTMWNNGLIPNVFNHSSHPEPPAAHAQPPAAPQQPLTPVVPSVGVAPAAPCCNNQYHKLFHWEELQ